MPARHDLSRSWATCVVLWFSDVSDAPAADARTYADPALASFRFMASFDSPVLFPHPITTLIKVKLCQLGIPQ
jgi:hypothetical protein